jgi:hypothetical protein
MNNDTTGKMPKYIYCNGAVWLYGYSNYYGMGYRKLTNNLRKHPKHIFIAGTQALRMLRADKIEVAVNVQPNQAIIDTITYAEYLKTQETVKNI